MRLNLLINSNIVLSVGPALWNFLLNFFPWIRQITTATRFSVFILRDYAIKNIQILIISHKKDRDFVDVLYYVKVFASDNIYDGQFLRLNFFPKILCEDSHNAQCTRYLDWDSLVSPPSRDIDCK